MMRVLWFEFQSPKNVAEAARILAGEGPSAMLISLRRRGSFDFPVLGVAAAPV